MKQKQSFFARISAPEPAPPWSLPTALLTIGFAFVAMIVGSVVALVWAGDLTYTLLAGWTLGGILIAVFVWQTRRGQWDALYLVPARVPLVFVMFVTFGCAIGLDLISNAITGGFLPKPELLALNPNSMGIFDWGFAIAFMVIIQPVAEGVVFRGVALPAVRSLLGVWGGLIVTATITGAFHFLIYSPNYASAATITPLWYGLIIPAIEAAIYSLVRSYTDSTRASMAAHLTFGLFAVIKLLALAG